MADKQIQIHPEALSEFKSAVAWYQLHSDVAAFNFLAEFEEAIQLVEQSPNRWPTTSTSGIRKFVFRRFPFAVIYREKTDSIQILAVAHGRRKPGYWKNRL